MEAMEALLGFDLDLWDYLTFLTLAICVVALIILFSSVDRPGFAANLGVERVCRGSGRSPNG